MKTKLTTERTEDWWNGIHPQARYEMLKHCYPSFVGGVTIEMVEHVKSVYEKSPKNNDKVFSVEDIEMLIANNEDDFDRGKGKYILREFVANAQRG